MFLALLALTLGVAQRALTLDSSSVALEIYGTVIQTLRGGELAPSAASG